MTEEMLKRANELNGLIMQATEEIRMLENYSIPQATNIQISGKVCVHLEPDILGFIVDAIKKWKREKLAIYKKQLAEL